MLTKADRSIHKVSCKKIRLRKQEKSMLEA